MNLVFQTGSIEFPRPTGDYAQDPDGWWRPIWTDRVVRDGNGREMERTPCPGPIRFEKDPRDW